MNIWTYDMIIIYSDMTQNYERSLRGLSHRYFLCHPALDAGSRDSTAYEIFGD